MYRLNSSLFKVLILALVMLSGFTACSTKSVPGGKIPQSEKQELRTGSKSDSGGSELDKILARAKKEGKVTIYSTMGAETRGILVGLFKNTYGIDAEFVMGKGSEVSRKLLFENNAGLNLADIYLGGATTLVNELKPAGILEPFEDLILADVKDGRNWFEGDLRWMDKDKKILSFAGYPQKDLAVNTDMVKAEALKSWKDILQPRWKGKIVMSDPTTSGSALGWFTDMVKADGLGFMKELVSQEPALTRDERQVVEWLAKGKYAIAISPKPDPYAEFKRAGAHLELIGLGRVKLSTGTGQLSLISKTPHPSAAQLFINWMLSREAQTAYSKAMLVQSRRLDVPTDHLNLDEVRQPGVQYFMEDEETLLERPKYVKMSQEIFGPLLK